jgi:hypothetical protein
VERLRLDWVVSRLLLGIFWRNPEQQQQQQVLWGCPLFLQAINALDQAGQVVGLPEQTQYQAAARAEQVIMALLQQVQQAAQRFREAMAVPRP